MTLVDTSVWVEYLAGRGEGLTTLLDENRVLIHPFIIGEVACGNLRHRARVLEGIGELPRVREASHADVMHMVSDRKLWGMGVGWVDMHLLASALITGCAFFTYDKRLTGIIH